MAREGLATRPSVYEEITKGGYDMIGGDATFKGVENASCFPIVSMQIAWTGRTSGVAPTSLVTIQQSNDGVNWDDTGMAVTVLAAAGSETVADTSFTGRFIRAVFVQGSTTGGDLKVHYNAKY